MSIKIIEHFDDFSNVLFHMERAKKVYAKCKMNCNLDYSLVVEDELVKWKLTINVDGIEEEENRL